MNQNNAELLIHKLMNERQQALAQIEVIRYTLDKWDNEDIVIRIELSGQLEILKAKERSIDKQIFDIRKNMA